MAERKKATGSTSGTAAAKPESEAKRQTEAKRESESKGTGKGGGSKAAAKTEEKGAAKAKSKPATKSKPPAKKKTPAKKQPAKTESKKAPAKKAAPKKAAEKKEEPQAPVVRARARFVRVAPRKARLVADQVRGLPIEDARSLLRFSPRGAARDIAKLIDSAAANAENNHDLVADDLLVADIIVDEGPTLRRYRPRALGRATKIDKRTSHIRVALTPEDE
jgi:ribosomal protein L22